MREKWHQEFNTPPPSRLTIYRVCNKFDQSGSVYNPPKIGRPVSVITTSVIISTSENEMSVALSFTCRKKRAASELNIVCDSATSDAILRFENVSSKISKRIIRGYPRLSFAKGFSFNEETFAGIVRRC